MNFENVFFSLKNKNKIFIMNYRDGTNTMPGSSLHANLRVLFTRFTHITRHFSSKKEPFFCQYK